MTLKTFVSPIIFPENVEREKSLKKKKKKTCGCCWITDGTLPGTYPFSSRGNVSKNGTEEPLESGESSARMTVWAAGNRQEKDETLGVIFKYLN